MKLLQATLSNFMPYKGTQQIAFPTDPHKNVMIVWGNNMRGKTSLLNALRWAFYGHALDRDRNPIATHLLVNVDALAEDDTSFSVFVQFEHEGQTYDLRRIARLKEHVAQPRSGSDYEVEVHLSIGTEVVPGHVVDAHLARLFPREISRFFLFDAELLLEYEALLIEGGAEGTKIRTAIEQVLGVPPLINGKLLFKTLLKQAQVVLAKENEHTKGLEAQSAQFHTLEAELASLHQNLGTIRIKEQQAKAEVSRLDVELSKTDAAQKAQARLDDMARDLVAVRNNDKQAREERLAVAAEAWKDLLQPRLSAKRRVLEDSRDKYQGDLEDSGALKARIRQLRALLAQGACDVCGQEPEAKRRESYGTELGTLEGNLEAVKGRVSDIGAVTSALQKLGVLQSSGAATKLATLESRLSSNAVTMTRLESQAHELRTMVEGFDSAEAARLRAHQKQQLIHLGAISKEIADLEEQITLRARKQNELSKLMSRTATARTRRSALEVELYRALESLFGGAINELRERLRVHVGAAASHAFIELTTDKSYSGLTINESYGLTIIDSQKRPVEVRSAGAEQIVALSLIDGLNRTAGRVTPIVIDTPLSRLDPKHRANVLKYVPTMAEQVVLLVHEGEIPKESGLTPLAERVGAVYEIEHVSSSHSVLRKVRR